MTKKPDYLIEDDDDYDPSEPGTPKQKSKTSKKYPSNETTTSKATMKLGHLLVSNEPKTLKATKKDALKSKKQNSSAQKAAAAVEPEIEDRDVEEEDCEEKEEALTSRVAKGKGREGHTSTKVITMPVKHKHSNTSEKGGN